jgi:hypothetical protein
MQRRAGRCSTPRRLLLRYPCRAQCRPNDRYLTHRKQQQSASNDPSERQTRYFIMGHQPVTRQCGENHSNDRTRGDYGDVLHEEVQNDIGTACADDAAPRNS